MNKRQRYLNKIKKQVRKDLYKFAYEQGRFDEWANNNIKIKTIEIKNGKNYRRINK